MRLFSGSWLAIVAQYLNSFQCAGLADGREHQSDDALAQFVLRNAINSISEMQKGFGFFHVASFRSPSSKSTQSMEAARTYFSACAMASGYDEIR